MYNILGLASNSTTTANKMLITNFCFLILKRFWVWLKKLQCSFMCIVHRENKTLIQII